MALPTVKFIAMTPEAELALGGKSLTLGGFPFRVGRESRAIPFRFPWPKERRTNRTPKGIVPNNELYIREPSQVHNLSREHFLIDWKDRKLVLIDRGSVCGTMVDGKIIGGNRNRAECIINTNDVIIAGPSTSPYVFKVSIGKEAVIHTEKAQPVSNGELEEALI